MKKLSIILVAGLFFAGMCMAADNDNHSVTVQVQEINDIAISGGDITLTIDSQTSGVPDDAVDNSCDLGWSTNGSSKKITVETNQSSPTYTLKAIAQNVSDGTAASEVTLSSTGASDFVTSVSAGAGSCDIQYTASATLAQGTGSDVHTVTYTITAS